MCCRLRWHGKPRAGDCGHEESIRISLKNGSKQVLVWKELVRRKCFKLRILLPILPRASHPEKPMSIEIHKAISNFIERTYNWSDADRAQLFRAIETHYCWQCGKEKNTGASLGIPACEHDLDPSGAAEIKRLEAEKFKLEVARDLDQTALTAFKTVVEQLRARIALLEAALQLPEGCDVFELQRAMKEGARTAQGEILKYEKSLWGERHRFSLVNREGYHWFTSDGNLDGVCESGNIRLYCINEGGK